MDFNPSYLLGLMTGFATYLCEKSSVEPENVRKKIAFALGAVPPLYSVLKMLGFDMASGLLRLMQAQWLLFAYIGIVAVLAPFLAWLERRKNENALDKKYVWANLRFNLFGMLAAWMMLYIVRREIGDFQFIEDFYIEEIILVFIPLCLWIAFSYQNIEQQNVPDDHDPSLVWKNQICNMLHLFNTYFWSLVSAVFVVSYTLYCRIHNMQIYLNGWYLVFLTVLLLFFYACGVSKYHHIYLVFLMDVPMVLASSIYWMSLFVVDDKMMRWQLIFVVTHLLVYVFLICRKEKIVVIGRKDNVDAAKYKICFEKIPVKIKHPFYMVTFCVIMMAYVILWRVPLSIERISFNYAEKCIVKICEDTDQDAAAVFDEVKMKKWTDIKNQDVDRAQYLKFLYDELRDELVEKKVITKGESELSYEQLDEWYDNLPL